MKYVQSAPGAFSLSISAMPAGGQLRLTFLGEPGRGYTIQSSTNLVNWTVLTNLISTTGVSEIIDAAASNVQRRFYRAVTH